MLFSSITFLFGFLPSVTVIYYTLLKNHRKAQNVFLCAVSILFYAWGEPTFVLVMLFSIIVNYVLGLYLGTHRNIKILSKIVLIIAIALNLFVLYIFKYLAFSVTTVNQLCHLNLAVPAISLPIGISFFTFQAMSYIIDVYRGEEYQNSLINLGLYISFFPQLIAGPIVRYGTVSAQIKNRLESIETFSDGVVRFVVGLGKKVLLANTLAVVADTIFDSNYSDLSWAVAWVGAIAYTLQIYYDFSGYSDMAIGLGKMFGFHFMENFDYPYISTSITEFWRRWHISLGSWFRDYVYFPLGGSRVHSKKRLIFNLFIVWMLTGIWHGANWTFFLWGMLYFTLLVFEKLTGINKIEHRLIMPFRFMYTILFVILGWVIFRASSIEHAAQYIKAMFNFSRETSVSNALFFVKENLICFVIAIVAATPFLRTINKRLSEKTIGSYLLVIILFMIFLVSIVYVVKGTYNPFIYFNF